MKKTLVSTQLRKVGCDYAVWGRSEIHELSNILVDGEQIIQAVNGYYDGGFAMLCTTNYRVLVIDKKPLALTVEDLRYDMIAEVDFHSRILTSVLHIHTPMRMLIFTSWSMFKLKKCMIYIQQRVIELRGNQSPISQFGQRGDVARPVMSAKPGSWRPKDEQQTPTVETVERQTPLEIEGSGQGERNVFVLPARQPMNPYTKAPLMARHRRYPIF